MLFWTEDPTILFNSKYILQIYPNEDMDTNESLNALSRFIIGVTFFGYVFLKHYLILILGAVLLGMVVLFQSKKEGYVSPLSPAPIDTYLSPINPLGNTLMHEYTHHPTKQSTIEKNVVKPDSTYGKTLSYETTYNPAIEKTIHEKTKEFIFKNNSDNKDIQDIFKDDIDNLEFEHQMRPFYTTANTTIPNDQNGFLAYCYGILPSDKSIISH